MMPLLTLILAFLTVLPMENQASFDRLQERVDSVLAAGASEIEVRFSPGTFLFRENHLSVKDLQNPAFTLRLTGSDTRLVAAASDGNYHIDNGYVDLRTGVSVDIREPVRKAGFWPIKVLFRKCVYKIRCNEPDRSPDEVKDWHIILSQWFKGAVYPVLEIRRGWLYFRKDQDYGTGMWSELRFGRCLPRYILCHPPMQDGLHPCGTSRFLSMKDCTIGRLELEGIRFLGNRDGDALIGLEHLTADEVRIADCEFEGIKSHCILADQVSNLTVEECCFKRNYLSAVFVGPGSSGPAIRNNRFLDNGLMMTNAPVVVCQGVDFRITGNYFEDFSYAAIGLGIHYTKEDAYGTCGIVEENEICMSEQFRIGVIRELIDGGAVYVSTINKNTVIRNNDVHDIGGPHGNRGIFADDGAVNVEISGNRVFRIRNGYCIDLRRCHRVGWRSRSKISVTNVGNRIYDNVYDGRSRIYVRRNDPTSLARNNIRKTAE